MLNVCTAPEATRAVMVCGVDGVWSVHVYVMECEVCKVHVYVLKVCG